jgi:hypothetical protein
MQFLTYTAVITHANPSLSFLLDYFSKKVNYFIGSGIGICENKGAASNFGKIFQILTFEPVMVTFRSHRDNFGPNPKRIRGVAIMLHITAIRRYNGLTTPFICLPPA